MRRKRILLILSATVLLGFVGVAVRQHRVWAAPWPCTKSAFGLAPCQGYFNGANGATTNLNLIDNVLPSPAFNNVTNAGNFISTMNSYLYSGNYQTRIGAAFIIDTMLNHGSFKSSGGSTAGVNYARANFGTWQALVNHYATAPAGASYGVNWKVNIPYDQFCGVNGWPATVNSAFFTNINDDAFHQTICPFGYTFGNPVIHFHWAGGAFDIGRPCGNVELAVNAIPKDSLPVGTISLTCDAALQQIARVTLSDPNGATNGYITTGSWTYPGRFNSPGPVNITIPLSATDPYIAQPVQLHVKDVGIVGTQTYSVVATANTAVPCVTLSCGSLGVTPSVLDPHMGFSITVSVTNSAGSPPPGATMSLQITPPAGATYTFNGSQAAGGSGAVSSATFAGLGPTNNTGVFTATWTLSSATVNKTCTDTFPVLYLPYLHVYGGDVTVGAAPSYSAGSSTCMSDANAGVFGWNNHTTDFSGAGAQYAVQALAQIRDFASAIDSASTPATGLSLANNYTPPDSTQLDPTQGLFGGYFGATTGDCDFTSDITTPPQDGATINPPNSVSGIVTLYANTDVFITHDVVYSGSGSWVNASQIPYLRLVVVGANIYIAPNVTQLDGLYVAEPDGTGAGGVIYTCATSSGVPADLAVPGTYDTCNQKLVVNGAFVAQSVEFLRTSGSLGDARPSDSLASNHAAEVFNYTPELWLPRGLNNLNNNYTAITGLPPVL